MELAVIILNYNTKDLLESCLKSVLSKKWQTQLKVIVVDNASSDDSRNALKKFPQVKVIENDKNLGFAAGNNVALRSTAADYYLLLNSDTLVQDDSLDALVGFAEEKDFDIVSCKLLNSDKTFQPNAGELPFGLPLFFWISGLDDIPFIGKLLPSFHQKYEDNLLRSEEVGWVSGTAMLIKKKVIDQIGLLDEVLFMYAEDTEYCFRAKKKGFKIGWTNKGQIIHLGGGSLKDPSFRQWLGEFRGLIYIYKKYLGSLASLFLKLVFLIFIFIRVVVYLVIGKVKIAATYTKILYQL